MPNNNNVQTRSTTSGGTSAYESNGFSSRDNSSGGVRLNNSKTPSTGGGTIYAGSASNMGSSRAATTSASFAPIKKGRTVIDMDAVREQHKDMRHEAAKKAKAKANDVEVSDSESD